MVNKYILYPTNLSSERRQIKPKIARRFPRILEILDWSVIVQKIHGFLTMEKKEKT
jgi:hypothetical protein